MNPIDLASKVGRVERAVKSLTRALVGGSLVISAGLYLHFPFWLDWLLVAFVGFLLGLRYR